MQSNRRQAVAGQMEQAVMRKKPGTGLGLKQFPALESGNQISIVRVPYMQNPLIGILVLQTLLLLRDHPFSVFREKCIFYVVACYYRENRDAFSIGCVPNTRAIDPACGNDARSIVRCIQFLNFFCMSFKAHDQFRTFTVPNQQILFPVGNRGNTLSTKKKVRFPNSG